MFCVGAYLDRVRAASSRVPSLVAWSLVCTDSTVLHTIFESNLPPHRHHPYQGRCGDYHKDCIRLGDGPLAVNGLRCHLIAAAPVASPKAVLRWWHTVDPSDPLTEVATAVHFSSRWAESFTRRAPSPRCASSVAARQAVSSMRKRTCSPPVPLDKSPIHPAKST